MNKSIYATHKLMPTLWSFLFGLFVATTASAQQDRSWSLGIAVGAGERSNPLISSDDIDIHAVIDFSWYGERFFFDNGDLGYTLLQSRNLSLNLLGTVNNERRYYSFLSGKQLGLDSLVSKGIDPGGNFLGASAAGGTENSTNKDQPSGGLVAEPDNSKPAALPSPTELLALNQDTALARRDTAINGGFELLYISLWGDVQAQVLTDISSTHNGQEAWLSWSKPWFTRHGEYTLTLGLEYKSTKLLGYYYGVTEQEAFPGRAAYSGSAGISRFIRLAARHALSEHWQLVGMLEREYLSSAISQSPVVNAVNVDTFFTGLYYRF